MKSDDWEVFESIRCCSVSCGAQVRRSVLPQSIKSACKGNCDFFFLLLRDKMSDSGNSERKRVLWVSISQVMGVTTQHPVAAAAQLCACGPLAARWPRALSPGALWLPSAFQLLHSSRLPPCLLCSANSRDSYRARICVFGYLFPWGGGKEADEEMSNIPNNFFRCKGSLYLCFSHTSPPCFSFRIVLQLFLVASGYSSGYELFVMLQLPARCLARGPVWGGIQQIHKYTMKCNYTRLPTYQTHKIQLFSIPCILIVG